ncbi:acetate/propionate family kinase [Aestuariimicrobium sp. T2.26MG-19.2B]|uniref:acetate/propionate family kinase n=1 Tax=Aestuariimicrobium sp. T2.26MG-19.2B TaxID=3040679 RepID=UPI002477A7D4|nr:acetate kinase [Aestuariimicrobium sp. T2.26MG-19.2B]CAI9402914.1 Acetate kinase [Aestuariimicrobium sp. T2.26MG-19.2B]
MARPILVLNCGSSSIKYQMIDGDTEQVLAVGLLQKVGDTAGGTLDHEVDGQEFHSDDVYPDHTAGLEAVVAAFAEHGPSLEPVIAVAHRTVHGGRMFQQTTMINDAMVTKLKELYGLAPLHNPPAVAGIEAARAALPDVPHVAVFDTAFFANLPDEATTYAIKHEVADALNIRKYGFHGTSHSYVSKKTAEFLGRDLGSLKQIVLHLGNGASASAIDGGEPIETSMGLTPLQGLVMGTRCGDVDPGLFAYLQRKYGWDVAETDNFLNKQSGMFGLTGKTDMRDVLALIEQGDFDAILGRDVYVHRLVSYIGSYTALLGGLDVLVFTAGVGENAAWVRAAVVGRLAPFGVVLDEVANAVRSKDPRVISSPESRVTVLVVPTNEELAMARETLALLD